VALCRQLLRSYRERQGAANAGSGYGWGGINAGDAQQHSGANEHGLSG
jgi:hypothetical protein